MFKNPGKNWVDETRWGGNDIERHSLLHAECDRSGAIRILVFVPIFYVLASYLYLIPVDDKIKKKNSTFLEYLEKL